MTRVAAISLGLGLSSAVAAELVSAPSQQSNVAYADGGSSSSQWSYFDPGFLVDHLPFRLTIGQSVSYSDNVSNLPNNVALLAGVNQIQRLPSRGDFFSDTTLSIASRFPQGAQTFFFNGTYAPRRYFTDTVLNADNYGVNGGVDYTIGDRCSGRLIGGADSNQTSLQQAVGYGVSSSSTVSFNETARCKLLGHVAGLLNTGVSHVEVSGTEIGIGSALNLGLNNYDQQYVGVGLEYALSSLDTLRGLATFTHRTFVDRPAGLGLSPETDQTDYQVSYSRVFSAKLDGSVSGGFTLFATPGAPETSSEPIYSFQLNYRPTPKIVASASISRSAGAPQNAVSNFQVSDTQSFSLSYLYSPKLNVTGIVSHSKTQNPGINNQLTNAVLFGNSDTDNASILVNYQASPLLTATAAYSYVNRTDTSRSGFDAVSNVFRVGLVYTR